VHDCVWDHAVLEDLISVHCACAYFLARRCAPLQRWGCDRVDVMFLLSTQDHTTASSATMASQMHRAVQTDTPPRKTFPCELSDEWRAFVHVNKSVCFQQSCRTLDDRCRLGISLAVVNQRWRNEWAADDMLHIDWSRRWSPCNMRLHDATHCHHCDGPGQQFSFSIVFSSRARQRERERFDFEPSARVRRGAANCRWPYVAPYGVPCIRTGAECR